MYMYYASLLTDAAHDFSRPRVSITASLESRFAHLRVFDV